jgi:primosomal protein N' (replication factor Y)
MYARVVVFSALGPSAGAEPTFDYHLPEDLAGRVDVGCLVAVPFGSRSLYGLVVELPEQPAVAETKPVAALVDAEPVLTPLHIALARWMSRETLTPLYRCLLLMLPPGVVGLTDTRLEPVARPPDDRPLSPLQRRLVELLERRGPLLGRQLDLAFPRSDWRRAAEPLVHRGLLARVPVLLAPRARPRQVTTVRLAPDADVEAGLQGLRLPVYRAILDFLAAEDGSVDVSWIYAQTGATRAHLDRLAERRLIGFDLEERWRDPLEGKVFIPVTPLPLTPDQQAVWDTIRPSLRSAHLKPETFQPETFLLHGVTGSGKTEIYLRAVGEVLAQGRKAIVLVPEISLTPQTVTRFAARFPGRVTVVHSQMSDGERYDVWRRARAGKVDVVVGARSALFTPLSPLGLIVLDEEHDPSYQQGDPPRYHARAAALELARQSGATVILGSATPSLESYQRAQRGEFHLLELRQRILGHVRRLSDLQIVYGVSQSRYLERQGDPPQARYLPLPPVQVVDMRAELKAGNTSIFSRALQGALDQALGHGEQAILFLNRRGTATFAFCRDCGAVSRCPRCDVPLTVHGLHTTLICHHCGYREELPERCPRCGGRRFRPFGLGTAGLEQAVRERWPEARLLRWDRDTARSSRDHWDILQRFSDGQAEVLVGTQMIAKGLDMPLVTVVGVILADTALNLPDFRAAERTFQLLEQVAGRAGRGLRGGRVVLQTYYPDHYAIRAVERHDYAGFAQEELAQRRRLNYPPFTRLARLLILDRDARRAQAAATDLAASLREALKSAGLPASDLIGPTPAFLARLRGQYRWQVVLRHANPPAFLRGVKLPAGCRVEIDPESLL